MSAKRNNGWGKQANSHDDDDDDDDWSQPAENLWDNDDNTNSWDNDDNEVTSSLAQLSVKPKSSSRSENVQTESSSRSNPLASRIKKKQGNSAGWHPDDDNDDNDGSWNQQSTKNGNSAGWHPDDDKESADVVPEVQSNDVNSSGWNPDDDNNDGESHEEQAHEEQGADAETETQENEEHSAELNPDGDNNDDSWNDEQPAESTTKAQGNNDNSSGWNADNNDDSWDLEQPADSNEYSRERQYSSRSSSNRGSRKNSNGIAQESGNGFEERNTKYVPRPKQPAPPSSWDDPVDVKPANESTEKEENGESEDLKETDGISLLQSEFDVKVKLADLQADPDSPLYSINKFEDLGLTEQLLKGIYSLKFQKPSKIQERALPLLVNDPPRNMIGQSQSGTGKTAAFVLTMLSRVDESNPSVQCLCLAPARELARQIMSVVREMGKFTNVTTAYAIPGERVSRGQRLNAQIVVGTPGTVMDMIQRRQLSLANIKVFVLDEADQMIEGQGLGDTCIRIRNALPETSQLVLFSATFPDEVSEYARSVIPNANEIRLKTEELNIKAIRQLYMDCDNEAQKYDILVGLYHLITVGSSIIFVRTRETADKVQARMVADGHRVAVLHGGFLGEDRDRIIEDFRAGRVKVLITTNVLARGIDIASVSMVINYDVPSTETGEADPETYLHRIGRTGRFGRVGVSITFVHDQRSWSLLNDIIQYYGVNMIKVPTDDWDEIEDVLKKSLKGIKLN
ncbi:P-loop containing nucleoside triphosphate hydrolase protein [Lipomyces japonicus]|uniref:P-loop containing nucleoside triphosphate hydrolase protein n=1 Tax=Lipomyces japonicus TaxID=56871 RepID=UPI0034CE1A24